MAAPPYIVAKSGEERVVIYRKMIQGSYATRQEAIDAAEPRAQSDPPCVLFIHEGDGFPEEQRSYR